MIVEINTEKLDGMGCNEIAALQLLYEGKTIPDSLKDHINFTLLSDKEYVLLHNSSHRINKKKVQDLLGLKDSYFWELFSMYPMKVPGAKGGSRSLRSTNIHSEEAEKCRDKYEAYLQKKSAGMRHAHVMRCLDAELKMRKSSGALPFMAELPTYINQQGWHKYEYLLDEEVSGVQSQEKYGEKLI